MKITPVPVSTVIIRIPNGSVVQLHSKNIKALKNVKRDFFFFLFANQRIFLKLQPSDVSLSRDCYGKSSLRKVLLPE